MPIRAWMARLFPASTAGPLDGETPGVGARQAIPQSAVEAEGLTRRFGSFVAVDGLSLRVPRGSIFGFLGPSGSGKTTTMRMLCGLLQPSAGQATVGGFDIRRDPERLRQSLGYMSQRFALYNDLSVRENLEFFGGVYE